MLRRTILIPTWAVILMSGNAALQAGEVNVVVSLIVTDPPAYVAALDKWFQSEDARGHSLSLFEAEFNGPDPSTHVIVAEFDSYARYQEFIARRRNSPAWQEYVQSSGFVSERVADFARFNRQVRAIRTILGTSSYRAVGRWSK